MKHLPVTNAPFLPIAAVAAVGGRGVRAWGRSHRVILSVAEALPSASNRRDGLRCAQHDRSKAFARAIALLNRFGFGLVALVALLAACSPAARDAPSLRAWVEDPAHGLAKGVRVGADTVSCTYRPLDLVVAQDLSNHELPLTKHLMDSVRQSYGENVYFALQLAGPYGEIENKVVSNKPEYAAAVQYLASGIAADTWLVTSPQDSCPALTSLYARQYGTTGRSSVLLVFQPPQPLTRDCHIIIHDRHFNLGRLRFDFAGYDLRNTPTLAPQN